MRRPSFCPTPTAWRCWSTKERRRSRSGREKLCPSPPCKPPPRPPCNLRLHDRSTARGERLGPVVLPASSRPLWRVHRQLPQRLHLSHPQGRVSCPSALALWL